MAKKYANPMARWAFGGRRCGRKFLGDESGATLVFVAVAMTAVMGMGALGLDVTQWLMAKRQIQTLADDASITGMHEYASSGSESDAEQAARGNIADQGFIDGSDGTVSAVFVPAAASTPDQLQVTVTTPGELYLASILGIAQPTILASAVATNMTRDDYCILALDVDDKDALKFSGSSTIDLACGIASNSVHDESIGLSGSTTVNVESVSTVGDYYENGSASLNTPSPSDINTYTYPLDDPYADLVVPNPGACDFSTTTVTSSTTLDPGTYCGNIHITGGGDVLFNPGVYIINNGNFTISGMAQGNGVTFILTGDSPTQVGTVTINGTGNITLTAPDKDGQTDPEFLGEYPGILFFIDPIASGSGGLSFTGGATMSLNGVIYAPSQSVTFAGGSSSGSGCIQIIANTVSFTGATDLEITESVCDDLGVLDVTERRVRLAS